MNSDFSLDEVGFKNMDSIKRGTDYDGILVRDDGVSIEVSKEFIFKNSKFKPVGMIRIDENDFRFYKEDSEYLTVFNFQSTEHKIDENYLLPIIVKHGFYKESGEEEKPVLDLNNCLVAKCMQIRNDVKYEELTSDDFKYSFSNIKNADELKKAIIRRYSLSMPEVSFDKMLEAGVGITTLKILGRDFH